MRRWLSISLVFLISWQLLLKGGVFLWFGINQAYIAENWCVNRYKPELTCSGKCVLVKNLRATDQEQNEAQQRPLKIVEKLNLSHFIVDTFEKNEIPFLTNTIEPIAPFFAVAPSSFLLKILKPPELLV
ncbi:MAG: hypothetical protein SFU99_24280 [Saprospiraceae bacterium]|nr:hypothetical protein [Saprospiraceae bacterium]